MKSETISKLYYNKFPLGYQIKYRRVDIQTTRNDKSCKALNFPAFHMWLSNSVTFKCSNLFGTTDLPWLCICCDILGLNSPVVYEEISY